MSDEQVPIWQVIEEFKEKIKTQEADIKRRKEDLEKWETTLRTKEDQLDQVQQSQTAKDAELKDRESKVVPREEAASTWRRSCPR